MASYSDEGFEQLAKTARTELGIDDFVKVDAIDFLRRLKHAGYISDYVRLGAERAEFACLTAIFTFHIARAHAFPPLLPMVSERSLDEAERNPGTASKSVSAAPDFASLHPGYNCITCLAGRPSSCNST